ncbi:MAG: haloacid dehalogenase type II [Chloroflexota bacterium]
MTMFRPKYVTFDCYGTLIDFHMSHMTREMLADRVDSDQMSAFLTNFGAYRFDEVLGAWKPYVEVIKGAFSRCCKRWDVRYDDAEAQKLYDGIADWGPHPEVPSALAKIAKEIPLVILSNASDNQIQHNVERLGAPFYAVYTSQQAQAYKPRLQAFEYMIDQLGCDPAELLHVSSSLRYDLMSAHDIGIRHTVLIERGHGPSTDYYGYPTIHGLSGLPALIGLE